MNCGGASDPVGQILKHNFMSCMHLQWNTFSLALRGITGIPLPLWRGCSECPLLEVPTKDRSWMSQIDRSWTSYNVMKLVVPGAATGATMETVQCNYS